jgi:hypothetical protein
MHCALYVARDMYACIAHVELALAFKLPNIGAPGNLCDLFIVDLYFLAALLALERWRRRVPWPALPADSSTRLPVRIFVASSLRKRTNGQLTMVDVTISTAMRPCASDFAICPPHCTHIAVIFVAHAIADDGAVVVRQRRRRARRE